MLDCNNVPQEYLPGVPMANWVCIVPSGNTRNGKRFGMLLALAMMCEGKANEDSSFNSFSPVSSIIVVEDDALAISYSTICSVAAIWLLLLLLLSLLPPKRIITNAVVGWHHEKKNIKNKKQRGTAQNIWPKNLLLLVVKVGRRKYCSFILNNYETGTYIQFFNEFPKYMNKKMFQISKLPDVFGLHNILISHKKVPNSKNRKISSQPSAQCFCQKPKGASHIRIK
jgi:hypothetical protein